MASIKDLESQAETDRAQIAATLEELRNRMSAGHLADQAFAYARGHGGAEFMRNLGSQLKANPLAAALIAASLGWVIFGQRRPASTQAYSLVIGTAGLAIGVLIAVVLPRSKRKHEITGEASRWPLREHSEIEQSPGTRGGGSAREAVLKK